MTSLDSLFDWTTKELLILSSYSCNANTTLSDFNGLPAGVGIDVSLTVGKLQAQAFKFSGTGNNFDDRTYMYVYYMY